MHNLKVLKKSMDLNHKLNFTFAMIKPDAVNKGYVKDIVKMIEDNGFQIIRKEIKKFDRNFAEIFYSVHKGKPFFSSLIDFITSGECVCMILQKENAIEDFRNIIGSTDPLKAKEGTIRRLYGETIERNAIHGSDSIWSSIFECCLVFPDRDWLKEVCKE